MVEILFRNIMKKGTKLYSIATGTCPKCQNEKMYVNPNPYNLAAVFEMQEHCGQCGFKYKIEPSFFFGAMYVSYGVGIAFGVAAFVISHFVFQANLKISFGAIIGSLIVFMPIIMRLSRNIWINFFVDYDKNYHNIKVKS